MTFTTRPIPSTRRAGFTLMELIVAIGITSIMLLLINQIFNSAGRSMNIGISMSDIIANERSFGEQLQFDARAMIGPQEDTDTANPAPDDEEGGVLVIAQYVVPGAFFNRGPKFAEEYHDTTVATPDPVRSDQLMFFRRRALDKQKPYPVTPKQNNTFLNDMRRTTGASDSEYVCDYLKVWYGHARKTWAKGSDDGDYDDSITAAEVAAADLGVYAGPNQFAQDWVLARQAMFLVDEGLEDPAPSTISADYKWDFFNTHIHAVNARHDADVSGYGSTYISQAIDGLPAKYNYYGLSDVTPQTLGGQRSDRRGAYVTDIPSYNPAIPSILNDMTQEGTSLPYSAQYHEDVLRYLYLDNRLRVNPDPFFDPTDDPYTYASWQVAQMHPVAFAGVSDFIVEFAADISTGNGSTYAPDGEIDRYTYDHDNDPGTPDISVIKWYGYWYNDPSKTTGALPDGSKRNPADPTNATADFAYNADEPMVFEPPEPVGGSGYTPYNVTPATANANATFVFSHDDEQGNHTPSAAQSSNWPYLIRIRFRAHDRRGLIESGTNQHGVWYEHVIKVNRPSAS